MVLGGPERVGVDQQRCTGATRVSCLCKMAGDFHHSTWLRGDPSECLSSVLWSWEANFEPLFGRNLETHVQYFDQPSQIRPHLRQ